MVLYKNSQIIKNTKIKHKDLFYNYVQNGGKYPSKLKVKYNNVTFKFEKSKIDDDNYILYATDDLECVSIIINNLLYVAEIHGIGNYTTCVNTTFSNETIGTTLLKVTIKMLTKYKTIFNINKIVLIDNSLKKCNNVNIELPIMKILLSGHTWYGKYGFRPVDSQTFELDNYKNSKYNENINIMDSITISHANILKYIKLTQKESIIKDVEILVEKYPNYLLKDFIALFLRNYDKTCKYFILFYQQLFYDNGLTNFRGQVFGLSI